MFKKQYVPMFTPPPLKRRTNAEHKVISKRDEEKLKNVMNEQHKVREMLNRNLEYRNSFLRSQRIMNYQAEKSRLLGLESKVIGNIRFYAPPVGIASFADSKNRREQIDKQMAADVEGDALFEGERSRFY
jgi:hypothetical protein